MEHIIKTDYFEGPFDLLLELIRKKEMDIYDLQISEITHDYLEQLEQMKKQEIEVTSYFMEMASMLLQIKTKLLMPAEVAQEDPRKELVQQLLDYQQTKQATEKLKALKELENKLLKRQKIEIIKKEKKGTLQDIIKSYSLIFTKKFSVKHTRLHDLTYELTKYKYTMEDRMSHLKNTLEEGTLNVKNYFFAIEDREESIVTFGALLELIKMQYVDILAEDDTIYIQKKGV